MASVRHNKDQDTGSCNWGTCSQHVADGDIVGDVGVGVDAGVDDDGFDGMHIGVVAVYRQHQVLLRRQAKAAQPADDYRSSGRLGGVIRQWTIHHLIN